MSWFRRTKPVEKAIQGTLKPASRHPSLLFFTVHKAASSFASRLLLNVSRANSIAFIDYDGYYLEHTPDDSDRALKHAVQGPEVQPGDFASAESQRRFETWFLSHGCAYAPLRYPPLHLALPHLDEFRVIVMTRDPRDCLTSLYYSIAYSHAQPDNPEALKPFQKQRDRVRNMEIDQFVLEKARADWVANFQRLSDLLSEHAHVQLVRYEQMVTGFPAWLDQVLSIWGLTINQSTRRKIMAEANFDVPSENVHSHKRQVQPGDHLRKLKRETIVELNDMFGEVLSTLGYSTDLPDSAAA